ncbi:unnamed protein product [Echinostoma caproni]|uniref:Molybdenum cofactor biosynthesis protein A-like twitch domain-containing protein n=1 Tax=Echinostoma caproni TaxID=27848 RepID=A0A3P8HIU3_9TREM|nr:unnamed protein product [Echinostoma caproni]
MYRIPGWVGTIGFITSMTANFCSACTRIRLTADGHLKVCLHDANEVNLLRPIREAGLNQEQLNSLIDLASVEYKLLPAELEQLIDRMDQLIDQALARKKRKHSGIHIPYSIYIHIYILHIQVHIKMT